MTITNWLACMAQVPSLHLSTNAGVHSRPWQTYRGAKVYTQEPGVSAMLETIATDVVSEADND
jgi:hypothetical protein